MRGIGMPINQRNRPRPVGASCFFAFKAILLGHLSPWKTFRLRNRFRPMKKPPGLGRGGKSGTGGGRSTDQRT